MTREKPSYYRQSSRSDGLQSSRSDGLQSSRSDGLQSSRSDGLQSSRSDGLQSSRSDGLPLSHDTSFSGGNTSRDLALAKQYKHDYDRQNRERESYLKKLERQYQKSQRDIEFLERTRKNKERLELEELEKMQDDIYHEDLVFLDLSEDEESIDLTSDLESELSFMKHNKISKQLLSHSEDVTLQTQTVQQKPQQRVVFKNTKK
jgi:hypothetical protein